MGLLCGGIVFGLMIGSVISIGFVECMDPITVVCIGIAQIFLAGIILVLPVLLYSATYPMLVGMDVWWSLIPLFLYVCADGLMLPHLISTALEPFAECAGTASALAGFWRFFSRRDCIDCVCGEHTAFARIAFGYGRDGLGRGRVVSMHVVWCR